MTTTTAQSPKGWKGRKGTDVRTIRAVQSYVHRRVNLQWSGWTTSDLEDLEMVVLSKYVDKFGHGTQPDDQDGRPNVPVGWLKTVVATTGIDEHRKRAIRPFDPADLNDEDDHAMERRLFDAMNGERGMSTLAGLRVDLHRALVDLAVASPIDFSVIRWRLVEDKTIPEVALLAGKSEEATKKLVQRATL
jgi:hypothetical protein